ncbi:SNF2-related protein [Alkalinema sp. FACHB-956]|uniref:SNF2-related protein n=1 Tax=Alkalinema sp. FACHB-956 TaxID=2692768 RepID=UPI001688B460|nr:SNF2-related protein [Alkalinema sp. FACHB-956]MBD2327309.1 DEAD/DEAH box helicase family protein [Alkalinema sp. FACHB-956]
MVYFHLSTNYQSQYYAYELTRRCSAATLEKLSGTLAGAKVDLNPHQVDAALFAFQSPLSKGALLADEVGLGKTIEAGLVISQKWAERKRRILVITPSNLRKQWQQELTEKFFVPCRILESEPYKNLVKAGEDNPFDLADTVVICSYQFARNKADDVEITPWDLVVIDEAHRLRNVYKSSNVIANTLKRALQKRNKLLLTATPLQNSLLELYGLVSFIDDRAFGDLKSFREQFSRLNQSQAAEVLKERLKPLCHRTLRRQVTAYVPFTQRHAILQEFEPSPDEQELYELVSEYLSRDNLQALPASQRRLTTLVMRKLLASSTFAIAGTLQSLSNRLKAKLVEQPIVKPLTDELDEDYEGLSETSDEWNEDELAVVISAAERSAIEAEIKELDAFAELATSIEQNEKGKALLKILKTAFERAESYGGARKAIIFTESRRTQEYLLKLLGESEWNEGLLLFNGTNNDPESREIYQNWLKRYEGTDRITGSKTADMRSALVDYFRDQGTIMIATEAGSEGINLQFCSLIVNYDLPWNPQRIEQRIGRCHRYGQKHDVVVVNFLNQKNAADQRVYELLDQKFRLFEGVFGSSDEVLGAIESGVDFEKRIADIYQRCRQPQEINQAFNQLQQELSLEIDQAMVQTRQKLLENFDDEVREKLKVRAENSRELLGQFERWLMQLTKHELADAADFTGESTFRLHRLPTGAEAGEIELGLYELPRQSDNAHAYRMGHPLAELLIERAKQRQLDRAQVLFDYSNYEGKVAILEPFVGMAGSLQLSLFTVKALEQTEDYLVFAAVTDDGAVLDQEQAKRLMSLPGRVVSLAVAVEDLSRSIQAEVNKIQQQVAERNAKFFEEEAKKLDSWAEDLKVMLERDIREMDRQIKEAKRAATAAVDLQSKLEGQKQVKALEQQRSQKRRSLFDAQDEIDQKRDELIAQIEGQLKQTSSLQSLFEIRWSLA